MVFDVSNLTSLAQVDIHYSHQDMNPAVWNASVASGAKGLVYAGVGAGGTSGVSGVELQRVFNATNIPIVASHRSPDGVVPGRSSGYTIASGLYNPQKARILLQLAISKGYSRDQIRQTFAKSYPIPSWS